MKNIIIALASIAGIELVSSVNPNLPGESIPDPEFIETIGKLIIQVAIAIVTIIKLLSKKKE